MRTDSWNGAVMAVTTSCMICVRVRRASFSNCYCMDCKYCNIAGFMLLYVLLRIHIQLQTVAL